MVAGGIGQSLSLNMNSPHRRKYAEEFLNENNKLILRPLRLCGELIGL
jgi:hypothetical protein